MYLWIHTHIILCKSANFLFLLAKYLHNNIANDCVQLSKKLSLMFVLCFNMYKNYIYSISYCIILPFSDSVIQRWEFSSDQLISSFFSKIFWNKMFRTWSKQVKNEGILALYRGFPLFLFIREHFLPW
jgi:hypothetical protein